MDSVEIAQQSPAIGMFSLEYGVLPEVDSASMSARFRICTARKDRQGDIIEPSGVRWDDWANAPVVMFDHGLSGIPLPVARAVDSNQMLHMHYMFDEDAIYSRAFFSERDELSSQMFGLVEEGFIRAASIHTLPDEGRFTKLGENSHHVFDSSVLEWSICPVGINPDAFCKSYRTERAEEALALNLECATRILSRNSLGGRPLLPSIAKCLAAVKPLTKTTVIRGVSLEENVTKAMNKAEVDNLQPIALAKALASPANWDAPTLKMLAAKAKSMGELQAEEPPKPTDEQMLEEALAKAEDAVAETETETETVEPETTKTPGEAFLEASHKMLADIVKHCEGVATATEKPEVQEGVATIVEDLKGSLTALEGLFATIYPDATPLTSTEAPADAEAVKSWVAANKRAQFQLEGLATRLGLAMKSPAKAKAAMVQTMRDLRLLNSQAKSYTAKQKLAPDQQQKVDRLEAMVAKLVEQVSKSPA